MDQLKRRFSAVPTEIRSAKLCRFCGCEDKECENIFLTKSSCSSSSSSSSSSKEAKGGVGSDDLLNKISTVYPFVVSVYNSDQISAFCPIIPFLFSTNQQMYENDPLPQHICPKCIANVYTLYREIQEVLRHQKMLMNLIRSEKPQHEYFRILNEIEVIVLIVHLWKICQLEVLANYVVPN